MTRSDWPIIGNNEAIDFLESLLAFERLNPGSIGGTYLFTGPNKVGRNSSIEYFIRRLLGSDEQYIAGTIDMWPDVFRLRRQEDKREIGVDQAREFSARLALSSFTDSYRIGIIHEAELLSPQAANALLKSLEEARDKAMIFLITEQADRLPATVLSRAQKIVFHPVANDEVYEWLINEHGLVRPLAKNLARLSDGRPGLALALARDKNLLASYLEPARFFINSFRTRLYESWKEANKFLIGHKGAAAVETAQGIINTWRGVVRDMMMTLLNQPELVRYAFLEQEIHEATKTIDLGEARRLEERLKKASTYLEANVNPNITLENILINLYV
jgi:DNA polymerase-3 subunit delta'